MKQTERKTNILGDIEIRLYRMTPPRNINATEDGRARAVISTIQTFDQHRSSPTQTIILYVGFRGLKCYKHLLSNKYTRNEYHQNIPNITRKSRLCIFFVGLSPLSTHSDSLPFLSLFPFFKSRWITPQTLYSFCSWAFLQDLPKVGEENLIPAQTFTFFFLRLRPPCMLPI